MTDAERISFLLWHLEGMTTRAEVLLDFNPGRVSPSWRNFRETTEAARMFLMSQVGRE